MRKLLLNPTPLFRKLRQLSLLLTLLLALPQTAWGQTTYDKGTYNSENYTWGNWQVAATGTTISSSGEFLSFNVVDHTTATITLTLTNPGTTSEKICYALFSYNQDENIPNDNKVKLLSAKIVHTNSSETDLTNDFIKYTKSCSFFAKTPVEWSSGDNFVVTLQVNNTTDASTSHSIQAAELKTGTPYGLIVNGITVTNVNQNSVTNKERYYNEQQHNVDEAVFTPEEGSNPATLTLTLADFDVSSASIAAIESSLGSLKVILAGENEIKCGNNKAFNLADNSSLTITTNGTNTGQLTITSTSAITTESFYSPSSATVTYLNGLAASNPTSTKVLINAPTIYNITVAGTAVTSANANGITGANINGTVTYDAENSILTLNGATLTAPIITGIGLTIDIKGTNTITTNTTCIQKMANTNPTLNFESTSTEVGSLTLTNENGGISEISEADISVSNELSVLLTLNGNNDYTSNLYHFADGATTVAKIVPGYGVSVGRAGRGYTDIYAGNKDDVLGDGKVSFNKDNNTLTLNNASGIPNIKTNLGTLNIDLIGSNSLYLGSDGSIFESSDGSAVTIKVGSSSATKGNLTLETDTSDPNAHFKDANVTLTPVEPLEIVSGSLTTNSGTLVIGESYGITVGGVVVNATNASNVFPSGANDGKVSFTRATETTPNTLTLDGATISGSIYTTRENLKIILKGTNTLTAESNGICSNQNTGTLTFAKGGENASLNITTSGSASVIRGFADLSYSGLYTATVAPHKIIDNASYKRLVNATNSDADTTAITSFYISESVTYQVWVGGVQVTAANSSGTGWSYNNNATTLTLDSYTAGSNDYAFISNMPNLNVYLKGTNTVTFTGFAGSRAFFSTYNNNGEKATLTFSTDENNKGKLDASSYLTFCEGFRDINGIYCLNGLGYYPSTCKIEAKYTPTMHFAKWDETAQDYTGGNVVASETLETTYGVAFKAPRPEYDNHYQLFADSTRYTYSYAPEGIVEIPLTATDPSTGKNTFGEMNILKTGTVTITCTYLGNMQNEACSASYTLKVNKADANLAYNETTSNAYIDLSGNGQWGVPNGTGATAPTLTKPTNVTGITYTSSNTNVATVSSTGDVTPIGAGEATITATLSNNDSYNDDNASYQLTVKVPATISFANATASVLNTATSYTQAATTDPAGATITYESSNNNVSVDANGQVTINNQSFYGPVTITATLTAVPAATPQLYYVLANEPAFQATYTLNVAKNFDISSIFTDASMNYATCILSEQLTKPDGLKVYYITGTNGNTVTTQEIDYLPYGIPILLEKTAATIGSVTARTDSSSVVSGNLLQYATSNVSATGSQYILYKNEFVKATGTIPSGKCYLQISTNLPARGVLGIGNDGSTAIEGIDVEATEDETWYDLQGRRIQKPTKAGIYIVNGKKVIINNK